MSTRKDEPDIVLEDVSDASDEIKLEGNKELKEISFKIFNQLKDGIVHEMEGFSTAKKKACSKILIRGRFKNQLYPIYPVNPTKINLQIYNIQFLIGLLDGYLLNQIDIIDREKWDGIPVWLKDKNDYSTYKGHMLKLETIAGRKAWKLITNNVKTLIITYINKCKSVIKELKLENLMSDSDSDSDSQERKFSSPKEQTLPLHRILNYSPIKLIECSEPSVFFTVLIPRTHKDYNRMTELERTIGQRKMAVYDSKSDDFFTAINEQAFEDEGPNYKNVFINYIDVTSDTDCIVSIANFEVGYLDSYKEGIYLVSESVVSTNTLILLDDRFYKYAREIKNAYLQRTPYVNKLFDGYNPDWDKAILTALFSDKEEKYKLFNFIDSPVGKFGVMTYMKPDRIVHNKEI